MNKRVSIFGSRSWGVLLALVALVCCQASFAQELLINGGFETLSFVPPTLTSQGYYYVPADGANGQPIVGWTSVANTNPLVPSGNTSGVDIVTGMFTPHNGSYGIDMVGTSTGSTLGSIQQLIGTSLVSGGFYTLSFNFGRFTSSPDPGTAFLSVSLVNFLSGQTVYTQNILPNPSAPAGTFTLQTFNIVNFAGVTGQYYLRFDALQEVPLGSDSGAYIDDVSLMVPEASTVWMAGITVLLVGRFAWKRFRVARAVVTA